MAESLDSARKNPVKFDTGQETLDSEPESDENLGEFEGNDAENYAGKGANGLKNGRKITCEDPLCNMSIDSVSKELHVATERIRVLQKQLADLGNNGRKNTTMNTVAYRQVGYHLCKPQQRRINHYQYRQSVAEIETVL